MSKLWISTLFISAFTLLVGCQKEASTELTDEPVSAANSVPFSVVATTPSLGQTNIPVDQDIIVTFNKPVTGNSKNLSIAIKDNAGTVSGTTTYSGNDMVFNPSSDFDYASSYTVTLTINNSPSAAAAVSTTASSGSTAQVWTFSTEAQPSPGAAQFSIETQTVFATVDVDTSILLGPLTSNGNTVTYTVSGSSNVSQGSRANRIVYKSSTLGNETLNITATIAGNTTSATRIVTVSPQAPSNYVLGRQFIAPDYGSTVPAKGESRIDPVTGIKITRLTDASELAGTNDAFIVYSRYTPENTSGEFFIAFGANSTSSWVINRVTGQVVGALKHKQTNTVGENHEVRWDISGNHPNRVYYRYNMGLYMIDDVRNPSTTLLHDFASEFPSSTSLYNDVEGDSSNDSDHWAFMAAHYNGSTYVVDAYIHYQVSTNTVHSLKPNDLAGSNLAAEVGKSNFSYRPNMVEMTPDGTGFIMHHGRKWDDSSYGGNGAAWVDTWYDGAWMWPADFDFQSNSPRKVSVGETHSGWAFDSQGREFFISQNNRTDKLDAVATTGSLYDYNNRLQMADHGDFGWVNGFHYGKMAESRPNWVFINTYANANSASYSSSWAADQLIIMKLDAESNNPTVWRIGSNYNKYTGDYRDEAPAAMNYIGNRIYLSNNWGGRLGHREVFVYELPDDWNTVLN